MDKNINKNINKNNKNLESRKIVLDVLMEYSLGQYKLNELIKNALDKVDYLDRQDKAFISRLIKGCVEKQYALDYVIGKYVHTKGNRIKPVIRIALRMGIYQILFMQGVKDYAACSETVNLVKSRGLSGLASFTNGVLRNVVRDKESDKIEWPNKDISRIKYLSVYYSIPEWIIEYLDDVYGEDVCEKILKGYENSSLLMVRVNEKLPKIVREECYNHILNLGVEIEQHPYYEYAYILKNSDNIGLLPGFDEGVYTVQDVSSQLCIFMADIQKGDTIVDICSAPGGKTMHAALLTGDSGVVFARDVSEQKLEKVRENAVRQRINNIEFKVFDGRNFDEGLIEKCDVVICDAPCSGLGIIGRKADIKYNITKEEVISLASLQREILQNAVKYLKKGGKLIYSTCTLTKEENIDNRDYIIKELNMTPVSLENYITGTLRDDVDIEQAKNGYLQFLPGVHKCDGFFISKYIKR